jgi:hypothetical protein
MDSFEPSNRLQLVMLYKTLFSNLGFLIEGSDKLTFFSMRTTTLKE